jgi:hypothetical protein
MRQHQINIKLNAVTVTSGTTKTVSAGPQHREMQKHHMGWVETLPSRMNGFPTCSAGRTRHPPTCPRNYIHHYNKTLGNTTNPPPSLAHSTIQLVGHGRPLVPVPRPPPQRPPLHRLHESHLFMTYGLTPLKNSAYTNSIYCTTPLSLLSVSGIFLPHGYARL